MTTTILPARVAPDFTLWVFDTCAPDDEREAWWWGRADDYATRNWERDRLMARLKAEVRRRKSDAYARAHRLVVVWDVHGDPRWPDSAMADMMARLTRACEPLNISITVRRDR